MTTVTFKDTENLSENWSDRFTESKEAKILDKIHPDVVKLFEAKTNDQLTAIECKSTIDSFTNINTNAMLFQSPFEEMIMLHHNSKIGGNILNKTKEYFGLFGDNKTAIPQKLRPSSILKIFEVETPCWDTIKSITTEDGL